MRRRTVFTDLSVRDALSLRVGAVRLPLAQFSAVFALNDIPQAQCLLAIGREARSGELAAIHRQEPWVLKTPAQVLLRAAGQYSRRSDWPEEEIVVFDGYITGVSYRKLDGQVQLAVQLQHWLASLASSSCLTRWSSPAGMTDLTVPLLAGDLRVADTGASPVAPIAFTVGQLQQFTNQASSFNDDVWGSLKAIFVALAEQGLHWEERLEPQARSDAEAQARNTAALRALARIEDHAGRNGDGWFASQPQYAVPLKLAITEGVVTAAMQQMVSQETIQHYASYSFWDKLVGHFCPLFGMAVVPLVDRALVIADLPGYRGNLAGPASERYWKEISTRDYFSLDTSSSLEYPLRGVGVLVTTATSTGVAHDGQQEAVTIPQLLGWFSPLSQLPASDAAAALQEQMRDGLLQLVPAPPYVLQLQNPAPPEDQVGEGAGASALPELRQFLDRWAQMAYVLNMLRGRSGVLAGKLRFDIAPGSLVLIRQHREQLAEADDSLNVPLVGCVARVTVAINAHAPAATTTFELTALRRAQPENESDLTSIVSHPLFGDSIHGAGRHGAPLIPALDLE